MEAASQTPIRGSLADWLAALIPTGTVLPFAGQEVPSRLFVLGDGSTFDPEMEPALAAAIGTRYDENNAIHKLPTAEDFGLQGTILIRR